MRIYKFIGIFVTAGFGSGRLHSFYLNDVNFIFHDKYPFVF